MVLQQQILQVGVPSIELHATDWTNIKHQAGGDPAAVAFDAVEHVKALKHQTLF